MAASSYNVVLLVDAVEPALKERVKLLSLRLLNYLTCRAGLGQVRWSYRFLNSAGGRCRAPRRSDLRELGPRGWDEYEEELEASWERAPRGSNGGGGSRAALTHTALLETLSDFQWDRPDITSPAKPAVLRGRRGRLIAVDQPLKAEAPGGGKNAVFLLSPCPHSRQQLRSFTGTPEGQEPGLQQLMERLLPRGLHGILTSKRVTLYWLDTSAWAQVWDSTDHFGYWTVVELMQLVGGRILPSEPLLESTLQEEAEKPIPPSAPLKIPCDSVLTSLISNDWQLKSRFPRQDGTLYFSTAGGIEECAVTLEPISANQSLFKSFVRVHLKGTTHNWNWHQMSTLTCETWVLQSSSDCQSMCLPFQELLHAAMSKGMLLIAEVSVENDFAQKSGVLSPISGTAAILNVVRSGLSSGLDSSCVSKIVTESTEGISSDLPDIVKSVLSHVSEEIALSPDVPVSEWIKQELSQSHHWSTSVIENWYPLSGTSGASSNLMESFRLISAASFDEDEQCFDQEITNCLSEFYQKKSGEESGNTTQGENQKKRLPRTPVRQKMKTMPRSLQMLNAARLNSKAQKLPQDVVLAAPSEKSSQAKRRSSGKTEPQTKKHKGFKSEDDLVSFLKEAYDAVVSGEDSLLLSCIRNAFTAIKSYLKAMKSNQMEADCIEKIKILLKTSKMIRQHYAQNPNKDAKLRECQIQSMFRLEMCVQCPSVQDNEDELELVVEEITDMLRIISLTEDPSFLAKFLATVLAEYIGSIPKILSDIYFSLGTQIPDELALALPSDGDDSLLHEGKTPMYSQPSISRVPSIPQVVNEEDRLEELRTRSAKKRRTSTLARHRSLAESSQTLRQIEIPKKQSTKEIANLNPVIMVEKLKLPLPTQPQKEAEATKVRRNLFVHESRSPIRSGNKVPRSQSVSAVEGLKHKRSKTHDGTREHHKLLTKKVTETPAHKQISNRLLQKQIKGRRSENVFDVDTVEESPEKDLRELDVRRSPRIKQLSLTRRNSSSFYASQPKSRNLERVNSASQQLLVAENKVSVNSAKVKSPKCLLFGEVLGMTSPPTRKARRKLLNDPEPMSGKMSEKRQRKSPRKTPQNAICEELVGKRLSQKSPRISRTPVRTPKKTPSKSPLQTKSAAKNLGKYFSPAKVVEKSNIASPVRSERLAQITPGKSCSPHMWFTSPLKTHVTPRKQAMQNPLHEEVFKSPQRTPKRVINSNTPAKERLQASCTPRKSSRLPSLNTESVTPTRYELRTPQKSVLSVAQTPTPKKCVDWSGPLPLASNCTPNKSVCSPIKAAATLESMSPRNISSLTTKYQLRTPQKSCSVSKTPTPKKHLEWQTSVLPVANECTPKKFCSSKKHAVAELSMSPKLSSSFGTQYALRTPQKSVLSGVKTWTPVKSVEENSSVFPLVTECTPKKSDSPYRKLSVVEVSVSPKTSSPFVPRYSLRTPQKSALSVPKTPTTKKCVDWNDSVLCPIVNECTPKKSEISLRKCTGKESSMSPRRALSLKQSGILPKPLCRPMLQTPESLQLINEKNKLLLDSACNSHPESINITPSRLSPVLRKTSSSVSSLATKDSSCTDPSKGKLIVLCEKLDVSLLESSEGSESLENTSQTDESIDIAEATVVPTATSDLKMKLLITRKPSDSGLLNSLPTTPRGVGSPRCTSPYGLRHTIDRRQREAAARLGTPKIPTKFSTPKSQKKDPPPSYEVHLEMKESGLPTLRFKRTDSSSTVDLANRTRIEESPTVSRTKKGDEGTFGELWCNRHVMKLDSGGLSPCLRSAHNTPGKSGLQTFICQSYTPKRCASNAASPTQGDGACPWTPSPKFNDKNGSDINTWPRKKKASVLTTNVIKANKIQEYAGGAEESQELVNKASPLNEFLLDGVTKLIDSSPVIDWKGKGNIGTRTLNSRKRCFDFLSPSKEALPTSKRSCKISSAAEDLEEVVSSSQSLSSNLSSSQQSSCEDDVFSIAVLTPPARGPKSTLSATGLLSLTHSPMLFKGRTPSSKRKAQGLESQGTPEQKRPILQTVNPDDSPFGKADPKHTINRTYSRKKLIT
ncbi:treslin [Gastrophryne carolinensis]